MGCSESDENAHEPILRERQGPDLGRDAETRFLSKAHADLRITSILSKYVISYGVKPWMPKPRCLGCSFKYTSTVGYGTCNESVPVDTPYRYVPTNPALDVCPLTNLPKLANNLHVKKGLGLSSPVTSNIYPTTRLGLDQL
jgi:hypothetical protein